MDPIKTVEKDMEYNEGDEEGDTTPTVEDLLDKLVDIYSSLNTLIVNRHDINNNDLLKHYIDPLIDDLQFVSDNIYTLIVAVSANQNLITLSKKSGFVRALLEVVNESNTTNNGSQQKLNNLMGVIKQIIERLNQIKNYVKQQNPDKLLPEEVFTEFDKIQSQLSINIDAIDIQFNSDKLQTSFQEVMKEIEGIEGNAGASQLRPFFIDIIPDKETINIMLTVAHAATFETREIKHDFGKDRGKIQHLLPVLLDIIGNCIWHDIVSVYGQDLADSVNELLQENVNEEQTSICISEIMKEMSICRIGITSSHGDATISSDIPEAEGISLGYPPNFLNILSGIDRTPYISDAYGTLPPLLGPYKHNFKEIDMWHWLRKYDAANPMYITAPWDREIRQREQLAYNSAIDRLSINEQRSDLGNIRVLRFFNFANEYNEIIRVTSKVIDSKGFFKIEFPLVTKKFNDISIQINTGFDNIENLSVSTVSDLLLEGIRRCIYSINKIKKFKNQEGFLQWVLECTHDPSDLGTDAENNEYYIGYLCGYYLRCILLTKGFGDSVIFTSIGMGSAANDLIKDAVGNSTLPIVQSMQVAESDERVLVDIQKDNIFKLLANGNLRMSTTMVFSGDYISSGWGISQYSIKKRLTRDDQPSEFSNFVSVIGGFHGPHSDNLIPVSSLSELSLQLMYATKFYETDHNYMHIISEMKELCSVPLDGFPLAKCFCESKASQNIQKKFALAYSNYKPSPSDRDPEKTKKKADNLVKAIMVNPLRALQNIPGVLRHVEDGTIALDADTIFYLQKFIRCSDIVYQLNKRINEISKSGELIKFVNEIKDLAKQTHEVEISNDEMPLFHVANYVALNIQLRITDIGEVPNFLKIPTEDIIPKTYHTLVQKQPINIPMVRPKVSASTTPMVVAPIDNPPTINAPIAEPQQGLNRHGLLPPINPSDSGYSVASSSNTPQPTAFGLNNLSRIFGLQPPTTPSLPPIDQRRSRRKGFRGGGKKKNTSIKKNKRNKVRASRKQKKASKVETKRKTVKHRKHKD
jgi:hypothetical protein